MEISKLYGTKCAEDNEMCIYKGEEEVDDFKNGAPSIDLWIVIC